MHIQNKVDETSFWLANQGCCYSCCPLASQSGRLLLGLFTGQPVRMLVVMFVCWPANHCYSGCSLASQSVRLLLMLSTSQPVRMLVTQILMLSTGQPIRMHVAIFVHWPANQGGCYSCCPLANQSGRLLLRLFTGQPIREAVTQAANLPTQPRCLLEKFSAGCQQTRLRCNKLQMMLV